MCSPTLSAAPTVAELAAVACPIDRAARISEWARRCGTLPGSLSKLRRVALREARDAGHTVALLAAQVGLSSARVSQLTSDIEPAAGRAS